MRLLSLLLLVAGACSAAAPETSSAVIAAGSGGVSGERMAQTSPRLRGQAQEQIVPGRALVELYAGVGFPAPADVPDPAASLAAPPSGWALGGVPLQVLRPLFSERDGKGAIVLVALGGMPASAARQDQVAATRQALARIAADPRVRRAEPDRLRFASAMPNDALYPAQWNLAQVNLPRAWDRTTGSRDVVVAVMDTGIVHDHPDLQPRLLAGYDFISDPDNAGDRDGRDPDPSDPGTVDDSSSGLHGTHVSGIIGAVTNNQIGVAGVDWNCRLLPVRVLGINMGTGVDSDIADAIMWAIGEQVGNIPKAPRKANVINMSFGGLGISFTLQRAVDEAIQNGTIVVAAAGNLSDNAANFSPGGLDGVITVGAAGRDGKRADYSNYGPRVDLLAPGGNSEDPSECPVDGVLSTYRDLGTKESGNFTYCTLQGTSQATPHVSGAAALALSLAGVRQLTMASLLRSSADHSKSCDNTAMGGCGAGMLDVDALLVLAGLQTQCSCQGDSLCLDGHCIDPGYPHVSIFADPIVHGGCAAVPGRGAVPGPGTAALLLGLAVAAALARRGWR